MSAAKPYKKPKGKSRKTDEGYIRPGDSKVLTKATNAQLRERFAAVISLLNRRITRHEIHLAIKQQYGVEWRQTENYISRAREMMAEAANKPRQQMITEADRFYENMLRNSNPSVALAAQREIRELFGLDAPKIQENRHSGPNGEPLPSGGMAPIVIMWPHEAMSSGGNGNGQIKKEPKQITEQAQAEQIPGRA